MEESLRKLKVDFYGHVKQYHSIKDEVDQAINEVLESGKYVMGPTLQRFEKAIADYWGKKYAIGVNSGTDALWLSLIALDVSRNDEVITTANTFFATAEAIWFVGAKPVFIDSNPKTYNIDVTKIEEKITSKTRAIIPVHLYGQCAEMHAILEIAKKHDLKIVEDAAQAIGARGNTFKAGELCDTVCTSFISNKNLGTFGDGGVIITNDFELTQRVNALRNHGSLKRSHHSMGYNSRLDDLHAAILNVKLKYIDKWNRRRREIAARYNRELEDIGLVLPYCKPSFYHVYHLYVIHTDKRNKLQKYLAEKGIMALTHYPIPIHKQEGYPWGCLAETTPVLPNTEWSAERCLSIPVHPELTDEEVTHTIETIQKWCRKRI